MSEIGQDRKAYPRRLIEVDMPIREISGHARREKYLRKGTISPIHIYWARRPLAACRAVVLASLLPDPADPNCPTSFLKRAEQLLTDYSGRVIKASLRKELLQLVADVADPDAAGNVRLLKTVRALVESAHSALVDDGSERPTVFDPFAGGGAIPAEALRVGADAVACDLNPVAALICKVILTYAPKYGSALEKEVRKWGDLLGSRAQDQLSQFYPSCRDEAVPIAYLWARTAVCEGPGCGATVPLLTQTWLAKKGKSKAALKLKPDTKGKSIEFEILSNPKASEVKKGTVRRGDLVCPLCDFTTKAAQVKKQFAGRAGGSNDSRLIAVVETLAKVSGRHYRLPTDADLKGIAEAGKALESALESQSSSDLFPVPDEPLPYLRSIFNIHLLDAKRWGDLHSKRQALAITTFVRLLADLRGEMSKAVSDTGLLEATQTVLALAIDRCAENLTTICRWNPNAAKMQGTFGRQALPIVWDWCEAQPFSGSVGDWHSIVKNGIVAIESVRGLARPGSVYLQTATEQVLPDSSGHLLFTDPPYYDAVPYADLSDFFYVWLRRSLREVHPDLLERQLTPKKKELVQLSERNPNYAYKTRENFETGMRRAMEAGRRALWPGGVCVVVFAHKETTAWETQLKSMLDAGWVVTASWPIDTEMASRLRAHNSAVLASSVHLVCRPREHPDGSLDTTSVGDWRTVIQELSERIHQWLPRLTSEGVIGADAIFACLGPALEVFSQFARVEHASGEAVELQEFLEQVWAAVSREALSLLFEGVDAVSLEEDARLSAMWLWTIAAGAEEGGASGDSSEKTKASDGYRLDFDSARKIAQGLGARLEELETLVEVKGQSALLLPVSRRAGHLFGVSVSSGHRAEKTLFSVIEDAEQTAQWGLSGAPTPGGTTLDRVHQAMLLFGVGRGEALRRLLVEEGAGADPRFWKLGQVLALLFPAGTDERRWINGVLAKKKSLGFS